MSTCSTEDIVGGIEGYGWGGGGGALLAMGLIQLVCHARYACRPACMWSCVRLDLKKILHGFGCREFGRGYLGQHGAIQRAFMWNKCLQDILLHSALRIEVLNISLVESQELFVYILVCCTHSL